MAADSPQSRFLGTRTCSEQPDNARTIVAAWAPQKTKMTVYL